MVAPSLTSKGSACGTLQYIQIDWLICQKVLEKKNIVADAIFNIFFWPRGEKYCDWLRVIYLGLWADWPSKANGWLVYLQWIWDFQLVTTIFFLWLQWELNTEICHSEVRPWLMYCFWGTRQALNFAPFCKQDGKIEMNFCKIVE